MRGHAFNARIRTDRLRSGDRVLDVTDHPDVNELILASDAAVLDYSSLRFDYVLSGDPMVFLVPDLEEYDAARGGVIPYATDGARAPGRRRPARRPTGCATCRASSRSTPRPATASAPTTSASRTAVGRPPRRRLLGPG